MSGATAVAVGLSVLAGVAGAVQVTLMGRFGERVGVFEALAFATALTALAAGVTLLVARQTLQGYASALRAPPWRRDALTASQR